MPVIKTKELAKIEAKMISEHKEKRGKKMSFKKKGTHKEKIVHKNLMRENTILMNEFAHGERMNDLAPVQRSQSLSVSLG